jgi:hypothetical protein
MAKFIDFCKQGYLMDTVPEDIFASIKTSLTDFIKINYNEYLVGQIEEEYYLGGFGSDKLFFEKENKIIRGNEIIDSKVIEDLEKYLIEQIEEYDKNYGYSNSYFYRYQPIKNHDNNLQVKLTSLWVNYQKKYEYNPIHDHPGLFSFVIWIDIPYDLINEFRVKSSKRANTKVNGSFAFHYIDNFGKIRHHTIYLEKESAGKMVLFPAETKHSVNTFYTSDEYRISLSGNLSLVSLTEEEK